MTEILSAEQPCIFCGAALLIVTWHRDEDTGEERIERSPINHDDVTCREMLVLFREEWPYVARKQS
jgi:hypothetical protein